MNIVFIGDAETTAAVEHIGKHRESGDEVYVGEVECGEQMVRRIIDADEVHLFHVTPDDSFELGMVYFFSIHARHYKLHWMIKIFGFDGDMLRMFAQGEGPEAESGPKLMDIEFVPVPKMVKSNPITEACACGCHGSCGQCENGGSH